MKILCAAMALVAFSQLSLLTGDDVPLVAAAAAFATVACLLLFSGRSETSD